MAQESEYNIRVKIALEAINAAKETLLNNLEKMNTFDFVLHCDCDGVPTYSISFGRTEGQDDTR